MKSAFDPVGLEDYYLEYLDKKNQENYENRYIGKKQYYHASGAGFCSRKLYYQSIEQAEPTNETPSLGKIRMRFGTIFHDDFQEALVNNYYIYNNIDNNNIDNIKEKEYYKKKKVQNFPKKIFSKNYLRMSVGLFLSIHPRCKFRWGFYIRLNFSIYLNILKFLFN